MLILYGTRNIRIRTIYDEKETCTLCGGHKKEYRIYQPCFHIFWIPFFPVPGKYLVESCLECNLKHVRTDHPHLSQKRTPIYMFAGILLILSFFTMGYFARRAEQKKYAEYVAAPLPGDVYLIKNAANSPTVYYFSKVFEVEPDSVRIQLGAYDYSGYVSRMDAADYFITDYSYAMHKSLLQEWLDDGKIRDIKRLGNAQLRQDQ